MVRSATGAQDAFLAPSFADPDLDSEGRQGQALRDRVAEAVQVKDPEFHSLGLVLGYDYADSPVVVPDGKAAPEPSVTDYRPSAHPGARLPHAWLPDGSSLYDLLGDGFTLVRLAPGPSECPLADAAAKAGVPLTIVDLAHLPRLRQHYGADLVLVRPDQHVAWRGRSCEDAAGLLARVIGHTSVPTLQESAR